MAESSDVATLVLSDNETFNGAGGREYAHGARLSSLSRRMVRQNMRVGRPGVVAWNTAKPAFLQF